MTLLDYLLKLKRGLGLAFGAYFQHDFSKNNPYLIYTLCMDSFNVILFSFLRYQTKCVFSYGEFF